MPTLNILGVTIDSLTLRGKKNAFMLTMAASGDLSDKLAESMGWDALLYDGDALRENWDSIELESSIGAGEMVLTPNGRDGKDRAIGIAIAGAESFKAVRKGGEDSSETKLTFKIKTAADNAEEILGKFWRANQNGVCKMKLTFAIQAKVAVVAPEDGAEVGFED